MQEEIGKRKPTPLPSQPLLFPTTSPADAKRTSFDDTYYMHYVPVLLCHLTLLSCEIGDLSSFTDEEMWLKV